MYNVWYHIPIKSIDMIICLQYKGNDKIFRTLLSWIILRNKKRMHTVTVSHATHVSSLCTYPLSLHFVVLLVFTMINCFIV